MGWNSTLIVLNDALGYIATDPSVGEKIENGVLTVNRGEPVDIGCSGHGNAMTVIETHHADQTSIVAIGGNCGQVLTTLYSWDFNLKKEEDKVRMLRMIAENLGYTIKKKPVRKASKG